MRNNARRSQRTRSAAIRHGSLVICTANLTAVETCRRRHARNHWAHSASRRRRCRTLPSIWSQHGISRGSNSGPSHGSIGQLSARYTNRRSAYRRAVLEGTHWSRRDSTRRSHVRVVESTRAKPVGRVSPIVVDVHDSRVADVHAAEVSKAAAIPREERLAPTQRAPAESAADAEAEVHAPSRAAEPRDQGWCVHRANINRTRCPSPVAAGVNPASIVKGSVSPGSIVNPRPAPGLNPNPVSILIRSPTRPHRTRHPNWTVRRDFAPHAVVIQVLVAYGSRCDVASRKGSIRSLIARR